MKKILFILLFSITAFLGFSQTQPRYNTGVMYFTDSTAMQSYAPNNTGSKVAILRRNSTENRTFKYKGTTLKWVEELPGAGAGGGTVFYTNAATNTPILPNQPAQPFDELNNNRLGNNYVRNSTNTAWTAQTNKNALNVNYPLSLNVPPPAYQNDLALGNVFRYDFNPESLGFNSFQLPAPLNLSTQTNGQVYTYFIYNSANIGSDLPFYVAFNNIVYRNVYGVSLDSILLSPGQRVELTFQVVASNETTNLQCMQDLNMQDWALDQISAAGNIYTKSDTITEDRQVTVLESQNMTIGNFAFPFEIGTEDYGLIVSPNNDPLYGQVGLAKNGTFVTLDADNISQRVEGEVGSRSGTVDLTLNGKEGAINFQRILSYPANKNIYRFSTDFPGHQQNSTVENRKFFTNYAFLSDGQIRGEVYNSIELDSFAVTGSGAKGKSRMGAGWLLGQTLPADNALNRWLEITTSSVDSTIRLSERLRNNNNFSHMEILGLNSSTANTVRLYEKYLLPNASPSVTNAVKQAIVWTGNGTTATPAFETISGGGGGGTVTSVAASGGTTGLTFSGSPITTSGTLTLGGVLNVANGGTGSSTQGWVDLTTSQPGIQGAKGFVDAAFVGNGTGISGQQAGTTSQKVTGFKGGTNILSESNYQDFSGLALEVVDPTGSNGTQTTRLIATGSDNTTDGSEFIIKVRPIGSGKNTTDGIKVGTYQVGASAELPYLNIGNIIGSYPATRLNIPLGGIGFEGGVSPYKFEQSVSGFDVYESSTLRANLIAGLSGWQTPSDKRLKTKVREISVLDKISELRGVSYTLKSSGKKEIGIIAQELEKQFPETVNEANGFKTVSYNAVGAIALQGVKELAEENEILKVQIRQLNERLLQIEILENLHPKKSFWKRIFGK